MSQLTPEELKQLDVAEKALFPSPIPVQSVSSDEFMPPPQTPRQRAALSNDRIAEARRSYEREGTARTNLAYGYVIRPLDA